MWRAILIGRPRGVLGGLSTGEGYAYFGVALLHIVLVLRIHIDDDADDVRAELRIPNVGDAAARDPVVAALRHGQAGSFQIYDDARGCIQSKILHVHAGIDADHHVSLPG